MLRSRFSISSIAHKPGGTGGGGTPSPANVYRLKTRFVKPGRPETIRRILVVEDEKAFFRAWQKGTRGLKDLDVVVIDPEQPIRPQVLQHIKTGKFDLIIMDGELPETSGENLTRELRTAGFQGYIAANSSSPITNIDMIKAGADFKIPDKMDFKLIAHLFLET